MKARLLIAVVAVLGYAILDGPTANATDRYFDNQNGWGDGLWSTAANWDADGCNSGGATGVPGASDHATICTNTFPTIINANAVALKVTVEDKAIIYIDPETADATLTLGNGSNDTSTLEGTKAQIVLLLDDRDIQDPVLKATLQFAASEDHTFTQTGNIEGRDNAARILIESGRSLTIDDAYNSGDYANKVSIVGQLQITGAGEAPAFINDGLVHANKSGTLDVAMSVASAVDDDTTADRVRWKVSSNPSAILRFIGASPASMSGDFIVTTGKLVAGDRDADSDDIDVATTGDLTQTGGEIEVGRNDSFVFSQ